MTLEQRIAAIVGQTCLTPTERAASILAQPEMARLRESDAEAMQRISGQQLRAAFERIRAAQPIWWGMDHAANRP